MSESEFQTCGVTVLPHAIPDSVIEDAAGKIDDGEVQARLHSGVSGRTDRIILEKSVLALEPVYQSFRDGVDMALIAQFMGTNVESLAAQTPLKVITLHSDNKYDNFYDFGEGYSAHTVVVVPIRQPQGLKSHEYVKGSHRMDHRTIDFSSTETTPVSLKQGQIMIFSGGLVFKNIRRIGEICAMFIYGPASR